MSEKPCAAAVIKPAARGEGLRRSAFSSLAIWRSKVAEDLQSLPASDDFKLRLLLEQTKQLEEVVFGCLKDALFELDESAGFGLLPPDFADGQRSMLLAQAAQELLNDKNYVLELARDAGMLEKYVKEVKRTGAHTLSDYDSLGALRLGLMAWRSNLHQELSMGGGDAQVTLTAGWGASVAMIRRCVDGSVRFWAAQQAGGAPGPMEAEAVIAAAEGRARQMLREIAECHHLGAAAADAAVAAAEAQGAEGGEEGGGGGGGEGEGKKSGAGEGESGGGAGVDPDKVPPVLEKYRPEGEPVEDFDDL